MADVENYKIEYFPEGEDTSNKMFKQGKPVKQISFVADSVNYRITYISDKGIYEMREDGALAAEFTYKDAKLHGKFRRYNLLPYGISGADFYPKVVAEGHYINGKKTGRWYSYQYPENSWIKDEPPACTTKVFCGDEDVTHLFDNHDCGMLGLQMLKKSQNR